MKQYRVVRFYQNNSVRRRVILPKVSLEQAQEHCQSPESCSVTCTEQDKKEHTHVFGLWFDGYEELPTSRKG